MQGTFGARGQVIPLLPNAALFSLFGNAFGGSFSSSTFGLPDLREKARAGLHYRVCNSGFYPARR